MSLDFDGPRNIALAAAIAAELGNNLRWWLLRNIALPDGFTDSSKRVSGDSLSRFMRALHCFPVPCFASADTLAKTTAEGSQRALSEKTIDHCVQALRKPLGRNQHGSDAFEPIVLETATKRHVTSKYILWQYLPCYLPPRLRPLYDRKRRLVAAATGELSSPVRVQSRELSSTTREPGSPESEFESGTDGADGAEVLLIREKADRFFERFGGGSDPLIRERVLRMFLLEHSGRLAEGTCRDVVRGLIAIRRRGSIRDLRAVLYDQLRRRGYDLDMLIVAVPAELLTPTNGP